MFNKHHKLQVDKVNIKYNLQLTLLNIKKHKLQQLPILMLVIIKIYFYLGKLNLKQISKLFIEEDPTE